MKKPKTCDCERLNDAAIRDLTNNATNRAHRAIGDACQLIDCSHQQHLVALGVICNLITTTSGMLRRNKATKQQNIAFILESIRLTLEK